MIPVEKIAGGTVGNLVYYVAIIGVLLLVATLLRLKIPFLRKAFIPASLLAGVIGLLLGPHIFKVIPADMMSSIGALPGHMITIVFACMLLGVRNEKGSGKLYAHDMAAGLGWLWSNSFMQVGVASLLTGLIFAPMMGINGMFGSVFEIGFAGGHGTAGGMAAEFEKLGWADGGDLGKTAATIGLLCGIFGGMLIINIGVRKKWTKVLTEPTKGNAAKEVFPEGEREANSYGTISNDVIEPFAFHLAVIGLSILIGRLITWGFGQIFGYKSLPLFPFAMIGGWLINMIAQRTPLRNLFDRKTFVRIQGMALEILVTGAVASISIPVVLQYWLPLLITTVVIMALMVFYMLWLSPRIFEDCWFEQGIIRYGAFTGVAAVGYMLLRSSDPRMETKAGAIYALNGPLMSPFIGGGLVTSLWPTLINKFGATLWGLIACGISLAIFLVIYFVFRVKNFKMQQR